MNSSLFLLCVALVIASVACQNPKPCETPEQWEGKHHKYDHARKEMLRGHISYDAKYQRDRFIEEFEEGQDKEAFDIMQLHKEKLGYMYNFKTKECKKFTLDHEFRDFGIPGNAESIGESYIGSSGIPHAGLLTTLWEDKFSINGTEMYYMGQWTYEACLPVSISLYEKPTKTNKAIASHDHFYDIVPFVEHNAFRLRKECEHV